MLIFGLALLLGRLAQITSAIILLVFVLANLSLIRLKRRDLFDGFQVPRLVLSLEGISCLPAPGCRSSD